MDEFELYWKLIISNARPILFHQIQYSILANIRPFIMSFGFQTTITPVLGELFVFNSNLYVTARLSMELLPVIFVCKPTYLTIVNFWVFHKSATDAKSKPRNAGIVTREWFFAICRPWTWERQSVRLSIPVTWPRSL